MGLVVLKLQSLLCALLSRMDAYLRDFNLWFLRLFLVLSISDMSLMAWVGMRISSVFSYFFVCPNSQQGGTAILMSVTIVDSELVPALVHLAIVGYLGLSSTHARNQSQPDKTLVSKYSQHCLYILPNQVMLAGQCRLVGPSYC